MAVLRHPTPLVLVWDLEGVLRPPIVEHTLEHSEHAALLDAHRRKHSRTFNVLRNRWNKFQRHRLRAWLVRARIMLKIK